ncbi:MAG: hypothetical protein LBT24_05570 [Tannerella sp.]|jgi:hypothetical protein|nr:hypothetical protein [Tannerella sp.]
MKQNNIPFDMMRMTAVRLQAIVPLRHGIRGEFDAVPLFYSSTENILAILFA